MAFQFENTKPTITDADLLDDLRRVAKLAGLQVLTQRAYNAEGQFTATTVKKRFVTWRAGVTAAGLEAGSIEDLTEEQLFDNLREVWMKLGRQPRKIEMAAPLSLYSRGPYVSRFGGWLDAMKTFCEVAEAEPTALPAERTALGAIGPRDPSLRLRFLVMRRDNFKCVSCGVSPATDQNIILHVDHILAWTKGGRTEEHNLRTLCSGCNLGKSNLAAFE